MDERMNETATIQSSGTFFADNGVE